MTPVPGDAVTICIPAWRSQAFIQRTLDCARRQTHERVRVLVSVDLCDDGTADICRANAGRDPRLEVFAHEERLGWARNVNFLLDRVRTPYFFLFFHDDVILPAYVATMLAALRARPEATSVHCDMGHFGASDHVSVGFDYSGGPEARLASFLLVSRRGSPLRSLTRAALLRDGLRLPTDAVDGLWANEPFLLTLVGAGPALRVPEALYLRWDKRAGGLTDGWKGLSLQQLYDGYAANTATFLRIIERFVPAPAARKRLTYCVYLHQMARIRTIEADRQAPAPIEPERVHPAFGGIETRPPDLSGLGEPIAHAARDRHDRLRRVERRRRRAAGPA